MAALPAVIAQPSLARFAAGALALLVIAAALGFAARRIRGTLLPELAGAEGALATLVVALALLVALLELLGALHLFETLPILLGALLIAVLCTWRFHTGTSRDKERFPIGALVAVPALALWLGPTLASYDHGIRELDSLWYHLPWAADFARTHSTTALNFADVEYLTTFYPATAEMLHGLGIAALGTDTASPALNLGWLAAALLAAWCVGARRDTATAVAATLGAAIALSTPMVRGSQPGTADNDVVAAFFVLAAAALVPADGSPRRLALAAVAAGLAVGTKLTALPAVAALTLGVLVVFAGPGAGARSRRHSAAAWLAPLILAGGYWYLRDWIAIGTPFPWAHIPGLPQPAPPLQSHTALSVAHYLGSGHFLTVTVPHALKAGLGTAWPALLVVLVAGPLWCLLAPGGARAGAGLKDRRHRQLLAWTALAATAAYLVTPQSAPGPAGDPVGFAYNLRYLTPPLALALALTPLALPPAAALGGGAVLLALTLAGEPFRLLAVLIALGLGATAVLAWRFPRAVAVAGAVALLAAGHALQRHYLRGRYAYAPGVSYLARVWAQFRGVSHARVAVAGTYGQFFAYPLAGATASNAVAYLAHAGPHGSFTPITTCAAFVRALNAGHYDYLVSTPNRDVWHPKPLLPNPQQGWLAPGPGARLVYRRLATGQPVSVWRITAPLNPAACR